MDYLQLADENIQIINLKYKNLQQVNIVVEIINVIYLIKLFLGDKSDNISPVFKNVVQKQYRNILKIQNFLKQY